MSVAGHGNAFPGRRKMLAWCAKALGATLVLSGLVLPSATVADTSTDTFNIKIVILKACTVTAGTGATVDFGSQQRSATNLAASGNISVLCTQGAPYTIGLLPGNSSQSGAGTLTASGTTDAIAYQLHATSGTAGTIWGNTSSNMLAGTGTGTTQTIPVYVTIASANFTPGTYTDTVTVTLNF